MPVLAALTSLTPTGTIASVKQLVIDALQGRTDISDATISQYVALSVIEITESNPFEELRTSGPQYVLQTGVTDYPLALFMNGGDDYTSNESFAIFIDSPNNTIISNLKYRTPRAIEMMTAIATQGIPAWWTRYGAFIRLGPTPFQPYTVFMRYQVRHPFSTPPVLTDPLYIPISWFDIISYAAAERIAVMKRWPDQQKSLHDMLWGDPEFQMSEGKKGRPGLIQARKFQVERDQMHDVRQLTMISPRYNSR